MSTRLHFKGGPWTNAEDQVLKAALAQYGLRDWERVASMLTKKTAAQCRERWEHYLDPRLSLEAKWTADEEERLVELHSLFPHQWQLISAQLARSTPLHRVRPAWLCEEHYQELRDQYEYERQRRQQQQQQAGGGGGEGVTSTAVTVAVDDGTAPNNNSNNNNTRDGAAAMTLAEFMAARRRRRAATRAHEEKAARADTVDGERHEKEMLELAVSRLANQDQKKGLRKERQRQLDEAAFLAKLESNREGLASGTLSLRQQRRMRRAIDEDKQRGGGGGATTRVLDLVREDDDDGNDEDDDNDKQGDTTTRSRPFAPIDIHAEEARSGTGKRQRTLLKDLSQQQQQQQRVGDGSAAAANMSSSPSTVAAIGVNLEQLQQLAQASSSSSSATRPRIQAGNNSNSGAMSVGALTWDALTTDSAAVSSSSLAVAHAPSLDDVFAALPRAVDEHTDALALQSYSDARHVDTRTTTTTTTHNATRARVVTSPPLTHVDDTHASAAADDTTTRAMRRHDVAVVTTTTRPLSPSPPQGDAAPAAAVTTPSDDIDSEAQRLAAAEARVAHEQARRRKRLRHDDDDDDEAALSRARARVLHALHAASTSVSSDDNDNNEHTIAATATTPTTTHAAAMASAAATAVHEQLGYAADVQATAATRVLERQLLQLQHPAVTSGDDTDSHGSSRTDHNNQRGQQHTRSLHDVYVRLLRHIDALVTATYADDDGGDDVLRGFVCDGRLVVNDKNAATTRHDSDVALHAVDDNDDGDETTTTTRTSSSSPLLLLHHHVSEYWRRALAHAEQQLCFVTSLRADEQATMRARLAAERDALQQLCARESALQQQYRDAQLQRAATASSK